MSSRRSGNPWTGAKGPSNAWPGTKQPVSAWEGQGSANAFAAPVGDYRRPAGRGWNQSSSKEYENKNYQPAVIPPSLQHGWQWRSIMSQAAKVGNVSASNPANATDDKEERKYADEEDFDTEDIYDSDEYDLDESQMIQMSHETLMESSVLNGFFKTLDEMKAEEINEPDRQWHCPACYGGPGAIDWYRGLQALITHAKTKGKRRVKAHRVLAQLLDEELRRKGTSLVPAGEAFGEWKGLSENAIKYKQIVWPPMVIIMNTRLERDDNGKWVGMGSNELLEYFSGYEAMKARHSYGPQGHRGMSVLIFEASAVGYFEADRLSKRFEDEGTKRDAWDHKVRRFLPGGQRLLYGYMAEKGDIDIFNQHSKGKYIVKFEMRSYEEMVVNSIRQMSEDNHLLNWYKNIAVNEKKYAKTLEDSFGLLKEKLRKTQEENHIVRQRTKIHHEQHKEEMDSQEEFFKEQLKLIHDARNEREENFEKIQQEKRENMKIYVENPSSAEDRQFRFEQGATLILSQKKAMEKKKKIEEEKRKAEAKKQKKSSVEYSQKSLDSIVVDQRYTDHQHEEHFDGQGNSEDVKATQEHKAANHHGNENQEKVSVRTVVLTKEELREQLLVREKERKKEEAERQERRLAREAEFQERRLAREAERKERQERLLAREVERNKRLLAREAESKERRLAREEEIKKEMARKTLKEYEEQKAYEKQKAEKASLSVPETPLREATLYTKHNSKDELVKKESNPKKYGKVRKTMKIEEFLKQKEKHAQEGSMGEEYAALPDEDDTVKVKAVGHAPDLSEASFPVLGKLTKPMNFV